MEGYNCSTARCYLIQVKSCLEHPCIAGNARKIEADQDPGIKIIIISSDDERVSAAKINILKTRNAINIGVT